MGIFQSKQMRHSKWGRKLGFTLSLADFGELWGLSGQCESEHSGIGLEELDEII